MRKGIIALLAAAMMFGAVAVGFAQAKELKLGHIAAPNTAYDNWAKEFKAQVEAGTNNRYKIVIYGGGQLGDSGPLMEAMQAGNLQFAVITSGDASQFVDAINVLDMPFLFRNWDHVEKFIASKTARDLLDLSDQYGLKSLSLMPRGYRHVTNAKFPITKPEDLKGLKMRISESPVLVEAFKAMGANAQAMAWSEVYTALQQGTVNSHENTIITTRDYKINEVQKYVSETGHVFAMATLMASGDWFKKLPAADQAIIQKAATDAAYKLGLEQKANEAKAKAELISKGMVFNSLDTEPFVKAVQPVINKYAKGEVKKFYDAILAIK
ncbi:MAG TPA: TRAP transporter substrate-binding protein [Rectinemataceae bacterium]|nr:TRAP transporter substrate-binding protein [Rectinemataceae bacterium]